MGSGHLGAFCLPVPRAVPWWGSGWGGAEGGGSDALGALLVAMPLPMASFPKGTTPSPMASFPKGTTPSPMASFPKGTRLLSVGTSRDPSEPGARGRCGRAAGVRAVGGVCWGGLSGGLSGRPSPALSPPLADEMNDHQNTLSYVLINPPPDTRLELNDIV